MTNSDFSKKQETGNKQCQNRSWELVYDNPQFTEQDIIQQLCAKKYGIYKCFCIKHVLSTGFHIHCGVILRDKPKSRSFTWSSESLTEYFSVSGVPPTVRDKLKCKSRDFTKKLQQYYNYCVDTEQHPNQIIESPVFHKWAPVSKDEKIKPAVFLLQKIRDGLTLEGLDDLIINPATDSEVFAVALRNFESYEKMILKLDTIQASRMRRSQYEEDVLTYRPFQSSLTEILNTQNDRNIHNHFDDGCTGKNYWLDREAKRVDTLILQNAKTKNIAEAWDPRKHRRIIFDLPRGAAEYINSRAIESLKNGCIFSEKYRSVPKISSFKPAIVILTNEPLYDLERLNWTEDRLTSSTTSSFIDYEIEML